MQTSCDPAVVIERTVAEHLEVLGDLPAGCRLVAKGAMLMPSMGVCGTRLTSRGSGMPATSRIVGATSITWWNWDRSPLRAESIGKMQISILLF